ncbi:tetratricopeptide repeat protein [Campylobacter ureolyticus]|uniref:tetratricopeptide repeat protein n=1 Tax=Campylobacter ureolyticus TaxID=827 RepID=UPI0022B3BEE6|nr:tetratricopeptide repeat protein [Campylobacter ureolyticus]MCZ6104847.1 tetratricopeptide repeat protein [Campylobacter ureolyticus]MCZ6111169.1 tetratricopeptide repeat protein [Campylobacter ureolyticus]MCZ6157463.1 tetratricopeptide repeat protein [Campylobacter ureolyticus]MCZ6168984.1 tetratricopeptide repeat protein [Campylobacter ureolyticus]MDK8322612.1 tetratricopeptide repeat protein [Campylobacter ureolyticus]
MRYYIGFILSILGIVLILFFKYPEFSSVLKAKESYNLGDYKTAAEIYKSLNLPKAKYNEGVANYKDGNFSESLQNFNEVKDDNLSFETLHNLGNTYANLHDFNKSISSFKKALEIKDDNDTRFNLELVEKIKDQNKTQNNQNSDNNKEQNQDKNQNSNQNSDNNSEQNNQNNSEQNSQNSKDENKQNKNQQNSDKQNSEKNEQQNDKQNDNKSNENQEDKNNQENKQNNDKEENKQNENSNIAQKSIENEQKEDENKENQNIGKQVENKKDDKIDEIPADIKPISDMEEAKWQKALEHRNIGTFLMPIGEKNHKNEDKNVKPW